MKTNEFGDLVSLVGGLDFDTTFEFYGCFLEEEIGKSIRDYDWPIEGVCSILSSMSRYVILLISSTTACTKNGCGNEFDRKMNNGTIESKMVKCSLTHKGEAFTSLHVEVVDVAPWS